MEATISDYRHKLNKSALRRLAQKQQRSNRQGLLPESLITTPSRQRSSRCSRHPRGSSCRRRWHLAPGIHHLIGTTGYRRKRDSKAPVNTNPKYSQDLHQNYAKYASVSKEWACICGLNCRMPAEKGKPSLSKTSIFKHFAAFRRVQNSIL